MSTAWDSGELATPFTVVDVDRLDANVGRMAAAMAGAGVSLRPHAKTHKSPEVARRQLAAGAVGLTCATLHEAQVFADNGIDDLFVAFPVWAGGAAGTEVRKLHERVRLRVGVENAASAARLGEAVAGCDRPLEVVVEVDSGLHRTGVAPADARAVADAARDAGLEVVGVFTHAGHSYYSAAEVAPAANDEVRALAEAAERLGDAGHDVRVVSAGSTPTAPLSARGPVTEHRPGTYVFGDRQQVVLGSCAIDDVALFVAATVVSSGRGRFVLDAGAKALSADRRDWLKGHGLLPAYPDAVVERLSDEHAVTTVPSGSPVPALGEIVAVIPNHVCPVVNLNSELVVVSGANVVDRWPVAARR